MADWSADRMAGLRAVLWERWVQTLVSQLAAQMVDLMAVMTAGRWDSQMGHLRAETKAEKLVAVKVCRRVC